MVKAEDQFLAALAGVTDPQEKRRRIGHAFIECFTDEAAKIKDAHFLAQGTLYPDVIESGAAVDGPAATIKLHHNVGGLPEELGFELIEPLRDLFKDEVRRLGLQLGLPEDIVWRHPFPGPGPGGALPGRGDQDAARHAARGRRDRGRRDQGTPGLYRQTSQAFAVLLPVQSVGVMGDARTYEDVVAVRCVDTDDFMTADWTPLALRPAGPHLDADHQRSQGRQPRGVRHQQQAAGDDRVGIGGHLVKARACRHCRWLSPTRSPIRRAVNC